MSDQTTIGVERPLRVGVIGVGVMGSNHARVFAGLPGTELVGIADPDAKQAEFVANTLGCSAVGDVDALISLGIDAVTVAAPTHLHRDIAMACIARGVHVMVEKPIASTVEEGHEIISAARRAGVTLMIGHVERFNPVVRKVHDVIRSGWAGTPIHYTFARVGGYPDSVNVGNNVLLDLAVQAVHVTNQSIIFARHPAARSRLVGGYMVFYSIGSAIGAISATMAYAQAGWSGVSMLGATFSAFALLVWASTLRFTIGQEQASCACGQ